MRELLLGCALLLAVGSTAVAQEKEIVQVSRSVTGLPFSPVVRVGDLLFLSGQVGTVTGRELAKGGIGPETRQTLENIKRTLQEAGSSMDRVVKCTVFLVDIADYQAMNEVYATYFTKDPPARSTVAGSGLAIGARVEIECIALAGR